MIPADHLHRDDDEAMRDSMTWFLEARLRRHNTAFASGAAFLAARHDGITGLPGPRRAHADMSGSELARTP